MEFHNVGFWRENAKTLQKNKIINDVYFVVLRKFKEHPGACHISSAVMYVLLKEKGIEANLCIGEVHYGQQRFDHSWVEVDEEIYDVAVINSLMEQMINPPIFANNDLQTLENTSGIYGVKNPARPDVNTALILRKGFLHFMDNAPLKNGVWSIVKELGREVRVKVNIEEIRSKYEDKEWKVKSNY